MSLIFNENWEFNVFGVYNYKKDGHLSCYYKFIKENHDLIDGDILESGVFRGNSTLATAMLLKELGSDKLVYGFDSFSGFPPIYSDNDKIDAFSEMFDRGAITEKHWIDINKNTELLGFLSSHGERNGHLSASGDFSDTSYSLLEEKIKYLGLDNIRLIRGGFDSTMVQSRRDPGHIMAVLMDCDLYESYMQTFHFVWPRMEGGGFIYLDEYYSLKFPGAKLASDKFLANKRCSIQMAERYKGEFERWFVIKD